LTTEAQGHAFAALKRGYRIVRPIARLDSGVRGSASWAEKTFAEAG
jgi:hypothetical protein